MSHLQTLDDLAVELNEGSRHSDMDVLLKCRFCSDHFKEEELTPSPEGHLCYSCLEEYNKQEADKIREDKFQAIMNTLDTDDLLTLKLAVSCYYEGQRDKTGLENLIRWNVRTQEAIDSKK